LLCSGGLFPIFHAWGVVEGKADDPFRPPRSKLAGFLSS